MLPFASPLWCQFQMPLLLICPFCIIMAPVPSINKFSTDNFLDLEGFSFGCFNGSSPKLRATLWLLFLYKLTPKRSESSDGSDSKIFDLGRVKFLGSGQEGHLWFWFEFGKFPLQMSKFSIFFSSSQKVPVSKEGQPLNYCGSKVSSGCVRAHLYTERENLLNFSSLIFILHI